MARRAIIGRIGPDRKQPGCLRRLAFPEGRGENIEPQSDPAAPPPRRTHSRMIEQIEKIKSQYTDKFVVVDPQAPELARFRDLVGQVKTVNMSGRALVEFRDYNVNIGWFDIDLDYLKVVDEPPPATTTDEKKAAAKKSPAKPTAQAAATTSEKKLSPLELARQQGAGGATTESKAQKASSPTGDAAGEKKLSPLEMARQQGAAGAAAQPAAKPSAKAAVDQGEKKLSPLEQARQQDARGAAATPDPAPTEPSSPAKQTAAGPKSAGKMSTADILAAARGGAKPTEESAPSAAAAEPASEPEPAEAPPEVETAEAAPDAESAPASGRVDKSAMSVDDMLAYCREHDAE